MKQEREREFKLSEAEWIRKFIEGGAELDALIGKILQAAGVQAREKSKNETNKAVQAEHKAKGEMRDTKASSIKDKGKPTEIEEGQKEVNGAKHKKAVEAQGGLSPKQERKTPRRGDKRDHDAEGQGCQERRGGEPERERDDEHEGEAANKERGSGRMHKKAKGTWIDAEKNTTGEGHGGNGHKRKDRNSEKDGSTQDRGGGGGKIGQRNRTAREEERGGIVMCISIFSMKGKGAAHANIIDQLLWHISNLGAYEESTGRRMQMAAICDVTSYEVLRGCASKGMAEEWGRVKLVEWSMVPDWYPMQLMQSQLDKHNKTLACFLRYLIPIIEADSTASYIFGDANDMVTPVGARMLTNEGQITVCIDEVMWGKSNEGTNNCYCLGGGVGVQEEAIQEFGEAVKRTIIEMNSKVGDTHNLRGAIANITKWLQQHQLRFHPTTVPEFMDQALLQVVITSAIQRIREARRGGRMGRDQGKVHAASGWEAGSVDN